MGRSLVEHALEQHKKRLGLFGEWTAMTQFAELG
jgi:hypothetical protein